MEELLLLRLNTNVGVDDLSSCRVYFVFFLFAEAKGLQARFILSMEV